MSVRESYEFEYRCDGDVDSEIKLINHL